MVERHEQLRKRFLVYFVILVFCLFWLGPAKLSVGVCNASKIEVRVGANDVRIVAHQASLIDVLSELSRQAEFRLLSDAPLDEVVTLNINAATVEDCIRQLISDKSHAMYYKRAADNRVAVTELKVFDDTLSKKSSSSASTQKVADEQLRFDPSLYEKAISDTTALSRQLKTERVDLPVGEHPPGQGGIQVTEVALDSLFGRIGIAKGDILRNVNGTEIASSQAFIKALQWSPGSPSAIRIERIKPDGQMDPIYIYIEQSE